ncbi:MAG: hypothetical protein KY453_09675 [Gemmatimonadetes bacterium]|nr:hypothetical protein [Gemmatimonadota bacterium]
MRILPVMIALFALLLATPVVAQERSQTLADDFQSFTVDRDATLEAPVRLLPPTAEELDAAADEEASETTEHPTDAPVQEVGSRNWLYLVAAIVAGGIILAVLL